MFSDLLYRVRSLFRRNRVESELDEELRFHFEQQVESNVREGMPRQQALRAARLQFGGLDQVKEECREARGISFLESLAQGIRFAARMLLRNPGSALLALAVTRSMAVILYNVKTSDPIIFTAVAKSCSPQWPQQRAASQPGEP